MTASMILVAVGLLALAVGGELRVRGAVGLARRMGVSTMFTGIVIVGAATSMPEMVASVQAVRAGTPEIAWGNIVGSNIANSLLILGGAALIMPIVLEGRGRRDSVVALLATIGLSAIAYLGYADQWIGAGLLAALVIYIIWRYNHPPAQGEDDTTTPIPNLFASIILFVIGVLALILGGRWLVNGAIEISTELGVSETVIGLTVVAVGTSLPELAASVAAAIRGHAGIALGNVLGSNIYNLLLIGGVTMAISGRSIPPELLFPAWPVCVAAAILLVLVCWGMKKFGRFPALLLLLAFAANTALAFR